MSIISDNPTESRRSHSKAESFHEFTSPGARRYDMGSPHKSPSIYSTGARSARSINNSKKNPTQSVKSSARSVLRSDVDDLQSVKSLDNWKPASTSESVKRTSQNQDLSLDLSTVQENFPNAAPPRFVGETGRSSVASEAAPPSIKGTRTPSVASSIHHRSVSQAQSERLEPQSWGLQPINESSVVDQFPPRPSQVENDQPQVSLSHSGSSVGSKRRAPSAAMSETNVLKKDTYSERRHTQHSTGRSDVSVAGSRTEEVKKGLEMEAIRQKVAGLIHSKGGRALSKVFREYDHNQAEIPFGDLENVLEKTHARLSDDQKDLLKEKLDNGSGYIHMSEFAKFMAGEPENPVLGTDRQTELRKKKRNEKTFKRSMMSTRYHPGLSLSEAEQERLHLTNEQVEEKDLVDAIIDRIEERKKTVKDAYFDFDHIGTGMTLDQLEKGFGKYGLEFSGKQLMTLFQRLKPDKRGLVSYNEFTNLLQREDFNDHGRAHGTVPKIVEPTKEVHPLKLLDTYTDDSSFRNYQKKMRRLAQVLEMQGDMKSKQFLRLDIDHDGAMTKNDLIQGSKELGIDVTKEMPIIEAETKKMGLNLDNGIPYDKFDEWISKCQIHREKALPRKTEKGESHILGGIDFDRRQKMIGDRKVNEGKGGAAERITVNEFTPAERRKRALLEDLNDLLRFQDRVVMKRVFINYDRDNAGNIKKVRYYATRDEFLDGMKDLGIVQGPTDANMLIDLVDPGKKNEIPYLDVWRLVERPLSSKCKVEYTPRPQFQKAHVPRTEDYPHIPVREKIVPPDAGNLISHQQDAGRDHYKTMSSVWVTCNESFVDPKHKLENSTGPNRKKAIPHKSHGHFTKDNWRNEGAQEENLNNTLKRLVVDEASDSLSDFMGRRQQGGRGESRMSASTAKSGVYPQQSYASTVEQNPLTGQLSTRFYNHPSKQVPLGHASPSVAGTARSHSTVNLATARTNESRASRVSCDSVASAASHITVGSYRPTRAGHVSAKGLHPPNYSVMSDHSASSDPRHRIRMVQQESYPMKTIGG